MRTRLVSAALALGLLAIGSTGCSAVAVIEEINETSPPPELCRPAWVQVPATAGSWIGGAIGGVVSIVVLPITWPLSLVADDELGDDDEQLVLAPLAAGAAGGHFLLGAPFDAIDWAFRRAWSTSRPTDYEWEVQPRPAGPMRPRPAAEPTQDTIDAPTVQDTDQTDPPPPPPVDPEPEEPR